MAFRLLGALVLSIYGEIMQESVAVRIVGDINGYLGSIWMSAGLVDLDEIFLNLNVVVDLPEVDALFDCRILATVFPFFGNYLFKIVFFL